MPQCWCLGALAPCPRQSLPLNQIFTWIKHPNISAYLSSTLLFFAVLQDIGPVDAPPFLPPVGFHKPPRAQLAQIAADVHAGEPICQSYCISNFPQ